MIKVRPKVNTKRIEFVIVTMVSALLTHTIGVSFTIGYPAVRS